MAKLTESSIARLKLPDGASEFYAWDEGLPGFGVRLRAGGSRTFVAKYRVGGQQRKVSLGHVVPGMLAQVREMAAKVMAQARLGQDVVADKRAAAAVRQAVTVGALIERYLSWKRDELKPRSFVEVERHLRRQAAALHGLAIETIARRDIAALIDEIAESSGRTAADRLKASLSTFFAWAIERGYVEANPAMGIKRRAAGGSRERVLTEAELIAIWNTAGEGDYGRIVRLLMLTGQRREEIAGLRWDEIDFERREIRLPEERVKNGRAHVVPLSDAALSILQAIPRRPGRALVFGRGEGGFSGWSQSKGRLDGRLGPVVAPWTLHDLRRTFATLAAEHDLAAPHVIEDMLNHRSGAKAGVAGVYNRSTSERGKRQLADRYGEFITALIEGRPQSVIAFRAAG